MEMNFWSAMPLRRLVVEFSDGPAAPANRSCRYEPRAVEGVSAAQTGKLYRSRTAHRKRKEQRPNRLLTEAAVENRAVRAPADHIFPSDALLG
jgi:hypothetical protein